MWIDLDFFEYFKKENRFELLIDEAFEEAIHLLREDVYSDFSHDTEIKRISITRFSFSQMGYFGSQKDTFNVGIDQAGLRGTAKHGDLQLRSI